MAVTVRGWLVLSGIGALVTVPIMIIALAVGGDDRSPNDPARPTSTADTVPNMYSRPPSPPYGARWAPPTWGDGVAGDSHGWSLVLVKRGNPDEDSVHVYTDTLTRLERGGLPHVGALPSSPTCAGRRGGV